MMAKIEGVCREVCEATEFVAIVTSGEDGPHVVGNWGHYMRALGIEGDLIVLPAGRYHKTEQNLRRNSRVQLMVASKAVKGTRSPGQGCLISGTGEIVSSGEAFDAVKAKFPWARGALVIKIHEAATQL
jgi:predicted pyridoxine 5'-phosphate oxidase superfamily flavin-nucleotide-binding protein